MLGKNTLVYQNRKQIIRNKLSATYFYRIKLYKSFPYVDANQISEQMTQFNFHHRK